MYAQYRYKGRYVSEKTASRLSRLPRTKNQVFTSIRESVRKGKPILESPGVLKGIALQTVYAMEKDRRAKEEQRERRRERERERTLEFKKVQAGYEPSKAPIYEGTEISIPFRPIPHEDQLIDEYFETSIEVADIDGDVYEEQ